MGRCVETHLIHRLLEADRAARCATRKPTRAGTPPVSDQLLKVCVEDAAPRISQQLCRGHVVGRCGGSRASAPPRTRTFSSAPQAISATGHLRHRPPVPQANATMPQASSATGYQRRRPAAPQATSATGHLCHRPSESASKSLCRRCVSTHLPTIVLHASPNNCVVGMLLGDAWRRILGLLHIYFCLHGK